MLVHKVPLDQFLKFSRMIYVFCDRNAGRKVLFPEFMNFWPTEEVGSVDIGPAYNHQEHKIFDRTINNRDLATVTSVVLRELIDDGILREVDLPQPTKIDPLITYLDIPNCSIYPCYEILNRQKLVDRIG